MQNYNNIIMSNMNVEQRAAKFKVTCFILQFSYAFDHFHKFHALCLKNKSNIN